MTLRDSIRALDNERSGDIFILYHDILVECKVMINYNDTQIVELNGVYRRGFTEEIL